MENKKRILIVDDHPLFRKGLKATLGEDNGIQVISEAGSGEEALLFLEKLQPDILILDLQLPGMSGIETAKKIKSMYKNILIILLTMHKEEEIFNKSIEYGIDAYLLKENAVDELLSAVRMVSDGNYYLSPSLSEYIINRNKKQKKLADEKPGLKELTEKEREILGMIALNRTTREIASELFVSYKTVENHRANICKKLNISGANALLKFIIENKNHIR